MNQHKILNLLALINQFEQRCKRIDAPEAVPKEVYELIGKMRDKMAKWAIEQLEKEKVQ
jgi:hypothetical protein